MKYNINEKRVRLLQKGEIVKGTVFYWMSRDQRVYDNWALLFAQQIAKERNENFAVVFNLVPNFLEATIRQFDFVLKGMRETEEKLLSLNIPFYLLLGNPAENIPEFLKEKNGSILISEFDPLKIKRIWKRDVAKKIKIPFYEVDAHNVVPSLYVSQKEEFAAYTIRPKIHKLLNEFLEEFPKITGNKKLNDSSYKKSDWDKARKSLQINFNIKEVDWIKPGEEAAHDLLQDFLNNKLVRYDEDRNNPTLNGQSNISPYLHFGQISAQRVALETKKLGESKSADAFLEELIIRKELADNFCYFNSNYDNFNGFKDWAKNTLNAHRKDKREFIYSLEEFENAITHEELWNAAQKELIITGKMHGYMRMYWAKKILEWSETPEEAMKTAVYLNDKYELDGRDPNGYTGCAWSIGGVHDRAWFERNIFGKIRYMNYNGAKKKFDTDFYINKFK